MKDQEPLAFLEKSHCVPILLALYDNGMLNRNQLYQELGETINIVIKRIDLLKKSGLVREFKMNVRPFAKYLALTDKGRVVACSLKEINTVVNERGMDHVRRVSFPFVIDDGLGEAISHFVGEPEYEREAEEQRSKISHLKCSNCNGTTYLIKDDTNFYWICFKCGTKSEANVEDAKNLLFFEKYMV